MRSFPHWRPTDSLCDHLALLCTFSGSCVFSAPSLVSNQAPHTHSSQPLEARGRKKPSRKRPYPILFGSRWPTLQNKPTREQESSTIDSPSLFKQASLCFSFPFASLHFSAPASASFNWTLATTGDVQAHKSTHKSSLSQITHL